MATRDIFEAVVAIRHPLPDADRIAAANPHLSADDVRLVFMDSYEETERERARALSELRERAEHAAAADDYFDPLLDELAECSAQIADLELRMRLLIAYAREYVRPQPYQLKDLAHAARMSISGVRIAYDEDEIRRVGELTGDKPRRPLTPEAAS